MPAPIVRSAGNRTYGGTSLGTVGAGVYAGMILVDGDDFRDINLVTPANPKGWYFTTRGSYNANGGDLRTPASGPLAPNVYVDPTYTGNSDFNRGVPMTYDGLGGVGPHVEVAGEGTGALQLMSGIQSTAEKLLLNKGVNPQRTAMIAGLGRLSYKAPCIIEARVKYPSGGPAGWHPTFWSLVTQPNQGLVGNEYGFEGNSTVFNAYMDDHNTSITSNNGTLQVAGGHDGNYHLLTILMTTAYWSFLIDGTEVNRIGTGINFSGSNLSTSGWTPANHNFADAFLFTTPAYNGTFLSEAYSGAAWTAATSGIAATVEYWRLWIPTTGKLWYPKTLQGLNADTQVAAGGAVSITLPSQTTLWGASSLTENICGLQLEIEEPGIGNNTTGFNTTTGLPAYLSYNSGTRVLSGTAPANAGRTHVKLEVVNSGDACIPFRFNIDVAPVFTGATTATFINGKSASYYDLYSAWDCGRLIGVAGGQSGKGLTATNLPTGMSLTSDGVITGTPTVNGAFTVATSCTNVAGQTTNQNVVITVVASTAVVAAPTLVAGTLVGSWDFNSNNITITNGKITAISGSDSTSNTLGNATISGPQLVAVQDGNSVWRNAARFVASQSNLMILASAMGVTTACTIVVVGTIDHAAGNSLGVTMAVLEIANGGNTFSNNRHVMMAATSTTGFSYRKIDSGGTASTANQGVAYSTTGVHYLCGRSPTGAAVGAIANYGTGANIVGGNSGNVSATINYTTLGNTRESNIPGSRYADMTVFRVFVYSNSLSDADEATMQSAMSTAYGTVVA